VAAPPVDCRCASGLIERLNISAIVTGFWLGLVWTLLTAHFLAFGGFSFP